MKTIEIAKILLFIGVLITIIKKLVFGWNEAPETFYEEIVDWVCDSVVFIGLIIYFQPLIKLYEKAVRNNK